MIREKTRYNDIIKVGEIYYYLGSPPGYKKQIEVSLRTKNLSDAYTKKIELLKKYSHLSKSSNQLVCNDLFDHYIEYRKGLLTRGDKKKRTVENDIYYIDEFLKPYFGEKKLMDIDQNEFDNFCEHFKNRDYLNHRKVLSSFMKWCSRNKYIRFVPSFKIPKWKRRERIILTDDEIVKIIKTAKGDILLFVSMYLFMGMRRSEIILLDWDRVDFLNNRILLREEDTKTNTARELPINGFVLNILGQRKIESTSNWVFPNRIDKARPMSGGFNKAWQRLKKQSGIRETITPHDLRATWEKWIHMRTDFTDAQREKMAGSSVKVQKGIYVKMTANDLIGLESVIKIPDLDKVISEKDPTMGKSMGNVFSLSLKSSSNS